jgi:hypothetical protein
MKNLNQEEDKHFTEAYNGTGYKSFSILPNLIRILSRRANEKKDPLVPCPDPLSIETDGSNSKTGDLREIAKELVCGLSGFTPVLILAKD